MTVEIDQSHPIVRTVASGLVTYDDLEQHVTEEEHDDALGLAEVIDAVARRPTSLPTRCAPS